MLGDVTWSVFSDIPMNLSAARRIIPLISYSDYTVIALSRSYKQSQENEDHFSKQPLVYPFNSFKE